MRKILTAVALAACCIASRALADDAPTAASTMPTVMPESAADHDARMAWWRQARFGMFIHWGVYSVPAGEYNGKTGYAEWFLEETHMPVSQYEQFAKQFNPTKFDADKWVKIAHDAGMRYLVITSKHHDGFDMFPSKLGDWGIKRTPFGRDPLKELSEACGKTDVRFCVYHSIMDWHHPDWGKRRAWNDLATGTPDMDRYVTYLKGQLKELVDNYHPGLIWFDGEWESPWTPERGVDLYNYCRTLDPKLIINNRVGKSRGSYGKTADHGVGDYGTPEQQIPPQGFGPGVDWESCMTMNNHWGYNKHDTHWKSTSTILHNLIDIASKGGNYLLNVGPTAEGEIPEGSQAVLKQVGEWMQKNGEAIYDTNATAFGPEAGEFSTTEKKKDGSPVFHAKWDWRCTTKPGKLYIHIFNWPKEPLVIDNVKDNVKAMYLLADPQHEGLKYDKTGDKLTLYLPAEAPDPIASVVVIETDGK